MSRSAAGAVATRFGAATLAELLDAPAAGGVTFVEGAAGERRWSHAELARRARARLGRWRAAGARAGDRVVLLIEDRAACLEALHAAWLGALVPVPVAGGTSDEHRAKLFRVIDALGGEPWLAAEPAALDRLGAYARANGLDGRLEALSGRTLRVGAGAFADGAEPGPGPAEPFERARPAPGDVALVQFSSGSTGSPKGVVLTHANLLANVDAILSGMAMREDDRMLSWMPLTHDMGLIGFHLVPRLAAIEHVIVPTALFVRRPGLWLESVSRHRASVTCSPNFGYEHALKGRAKGAELDLSSVRLVFNGAEPISATVAERFLAAFAPAGLERGAMFPVYGLAEASLAVTFPEIGAPMRVERLAREALGVGDASRAPREGEGAVELVGVGRPIDHVALRIGDADGAELEPGRVGRILIRGPNVTAGYAVRPGELDTGSVDADGWLDTGDLGVVRGGELFVTGRAKDLVFAAGRNLYPADLERALAEAGAAAAGRAVIAAVPTADAGRDLLVAFVQHRGDAEAFGPVADRVRAALSAEAGVGCDLVVAVARVPKTTSGKVQRFRLVEALLAGELDVAPGALEDALAAPSAVGGEGDGDADDGDDAAAAPSGREAILERLLASCRARTGGAEVGPGDNLFELGISSVALASIHADIDATWPGALDITDLFDAPSPAEIADVLVERAGGA